MSVLRVFAGVRGDDLRACGLDEMAAKIDAVPPPERMSEAFMVHSARTLSFPTIQAIADAYGNFAVLRQNLRDLTHAQAASDSDVDRALVSLAFLAQTKAPDAFDKWNSVVPSKFHVDASSCFLAYTYVFQQLGNPLVAERKQALCKWLLD